jgi:hypothetical protein
MSRPAYETDEDRKREEACAFRFAERARCNVRKLGGQYARLDWLALWPNTGKQAWIEIKCRKVPYNAYPSLMLSAAKWAEGVRLAEATGTMFLVVAAYTDGDYVYAFDPDHLDNHRVRLDYGGRTRATRDTGDVEPVVHISSHLFWKVP